MPWAAADNILQIELFDEDSITSFQTAQSSLASYETASSGSQTSWRSTSIHLGQHNMLPRLRPSSKTHGSLHYGGKDDPFHALVREVVATITTRSRSETKRASQPLNYRERPEHIVQEALSPIRFMGTHNLYSTPHTVVHKLVGQLVGLCNSNVLIFDLLEEASRSALCADIATLVSRYLAIEGRSKSSASPAEVFSSDWLSHLHTRGILLDKAEELDWSGKGQHVEYSPQEETAIPLTYEKTLGHSQTAVVESVRCRRIRLARKKIVCSRRLKKEDAINEVEHLVRLHHLHIVRVVGTYTLKRELAILLYPAAEWDLEKFMDELCDDASEISTYESSFENGAHALVTFFGCLSNAVEYIHSKNVKHMDIKPKNILVRRRSGRYRVYIADFGIARAYASAADAMTDSPTSFTRTYAAPEVVDQDTRGFSADIFSLGCAYMEMMATLCSCLLVDETHDKRQELLEMQRSNSNPSFYANIDKLTRWYGTIIAYHALHGPIRLGHSAVKIVPSMTRREPDSRPSASELKEVMAGVDCSECGNGPEPFEAAD